MIRAMTDAAPTSDLAGWRVAPFTAADLTHDCYEKGEGPGVVLVPEVPGMTPEVLGLADHLVDSGFTVVVPSPYGVPGKPMTGGYAMSVIARLCVSAEFRAFATNAKRPFTAWLRALARDLAGRTNGTGVGVIGMCFSGGFALAAAVDDVVLAPVISQPSLPFPVNAAHRRDPGVSVAELEQVAARTKGDNLCLLGLGFSADPAGSKERFATIAAALGDAFEVIELDSSPGNPAGFGRNAHSVLTREVRERPDHPAFLARVRVVDFLRERLILG
jgi:dienelactone hydrolase